MRYVIGIFILIFRICLVPSSMMVLLAFPFFSSEILAIGFPMHCATATHCIGRSATLIQYVPFSSSLCTCVMPVPISFLSPAPSYQGFESPLHHVSHRLSGLYHPIPSVTCLAVMLWGISYSIITLSAISNLNFKKN